MTGNGMRSFVKVVEVVEGEIVDVAFACLSPTRADR
jgi:hypothetical protein